MQYKYNKDELKESLSINQVLDLVAELGGEPQMDKSGLYFTSRTICHNKVGEGSHKLYYYDNTKLFRCYTDCGTTFDIFELVRKVRTIAAGVTCPLPEAIAFVASFFGYSSDAFEENEIESQLEDWAILNHYKKIINENNKQIVELKIYDDKILKNLPRPRIIPWEQEGITNEVILDRGICYDASSSSIVLPHYDINNNLIGIRGRTLIKENEIYGKYRPLFINHQLYNHPLGFNLYNLNKSKDNIKVIQKAIVFEGEKSCLKYASFFGMDNDISVAVCGSSFISYQVDLLLSLGVKEIIIAFDKQFKELNDEEHKRWVKKLKDINTKYSNKCQISFMFDKKNLLGYKDSPIDKDKETFLELFKRRIIL